MKEQKKRKIKERKGITLIALVITIIVLLILAGVTLGLLTGENGILYRAQEAKKGTETAQTEEQVNLAVNGALTKGIGKVGYTDLKDEMDAQFGVGKYTITPESETATTWIVTVNGKKYSISEVGTVADTELPEELKIGDEVAYNPTNSTVTSVSVSTEESGTDSVQTINLETTMKWQVLSIDRNTGVVELVGDPTSKYLTLYGKKGFLNAETTLNKVGAMYGYGYGAQSGRSITVDDIYKLYEQQKPSTYNSWYGDEKTYTSGVFLKEIKDENGIITGYESNNGEPFEATETNPITLTENNILPTLATSSMITDEIAEMIFGSSSNWNYVFCATRFSVNGQFRD